MHVRKKRQDKSLYCPRHLFGQSWFRSLPPHVLTVNKSTDSCADCRRRGVSESGRFAIPALAEHLHVQNPKIYRDSITSLTELKLDDINKRTGFSIPQCFATNKTQGPKKCVYPINHVSRDHRLIVDDAAVHSKLVLISSELPYAGSATSRSPRLQFNNSPAGRYNVRLVDSPIRPPEPRFRLPARFLLDLSP